jgi:hypothetical protein
MQLLLIQFDLNYKKAMSRYLTGNAGVGLLRGGHPISHVIASDRPPYCAARRRESRNSPNRRGVEYRRRCVLMGIPPQGRFRLSHIDTGRSVFRSGLRAPCVLRCNHIGVLWRHPVRPWRVAGGRRRLYAGFPARAFACLAWILVVDTRLCCLPVRSRFRSWREAFSRTCSLPDPALIHS